MDDAGVALLVIALLTVPVLIIILLAVYIVKANRLTRQVADLESNLDLMGRDIAALIQDVKRLKVSPGPSPPVSAEVTAPSEAPKPAPDADAPSAPAPQTPVMAPPQAPPQQVPVAPPQAPPAAVTLEPRAPLRPQPPPVVPVPHQQPVVHPAPPAQAAAAGAFGAPSKTTRPSAAPPPPSRNRAEWEALIGGKLLNRIGALALIIGVFFFLKYAYDKNWIPPWIRVAIAVLIGASLELGGTTAYKRGLQVFAQGVIGAGIAILYGAGYAASPNFYNVVDQKTAFLMMSAVTVITFVLAFRYNSFAVSFLGWLGGFLTPFLLSTGHANEVGLFTYIALLDAGLLAVIAVKDSWVILE